MPRLTRRLSHLAAMLTLMLLAPFLAAHAQDTPPAQPTPIESPAAPAPVTLEGQLAELREASFSRKTEIATTIAASGHPQALAILNAMLDGTLFATKDGRVLIAPVPPSTDYTDALTTEAVPGVDPATLDKISVNNRLRKTLRGLSARLSLSSPDIALRRKAAVDSFTSGDPDLLPAIEEALKTETDESIRTLLTDALAVIALRSETASESEKLKAIARLKARGDAEALNILSTADAAQSPAIKAAVDEAVQSINDTIARWSAVQNVYFGISLGSVLLLAAIGLAITFGVMGVINMAHGELIMIGAYTTFVVQRLLIEFAPGLMNWSLVIAVPAAFLVAGGIGVLIERGIIRYLYGRPLETLLATWGLSLILQQTIRTIFGPTNQEVRAPDWMSGSFQLGQISITYSRLAIIIFALMVLFALILFLKRTHFGMQMRAVTQNRRMAASMGVRTNWVDALTFGLGSGIAGIAGVALSQIDNVSPNLGQTYIIDSFMVVVFGGVGNLWGTFVGAMTLGIANKFLEPYAGAVVAKILVLVLIILFIQWRPRGLFALKGRAVEA